jgi:hypothetical protein
MKGEKEKEKKRKERKNIHKEMGKKMIYENLCF